MTTPAGHKPSNQFRLNYSKQQRQGVALWLNNILIEIEKFKGDVTEQPSITKMRELLETDGTARMYVTQMLQQSHGETRQGTFGKIKSIDQLLHILNHIITRAPIYNPNPDLTGADTFPMSSLFTEMMATDAGESAFRNAAFNNALTAVLQAWCDYLDSESSTSVLNESDNGWLSKRAQEYTDLKDFVVPDRKAPHFGFKSYNAFFHREIKPELRPIAEPDNPKVIVSPNDGTIYQVATNIQKTSDFWLKGQTYSLINVLNNSAYVDQFIGGSIVQTFLSGNNYHRFHAPIDGTVVKTEIVQGLTFSQRNSEKEPGAGTESLGYEASVNTRGLAYIQSDDKTIGTVCVIPIGITEISSVRFEDGIEEGAKVRKGQPLGRFSYGGSTLCVVFQANAIKRFVSQPSNSPEQGEQAASVVYVNAEMAIAN